MKGIVKALIAGGVIIAIGIVILIIGLALSGWTTGPKDFEMQRYEAVDENSALKVEFGAGNLKIVFYDGEKIAVDYPTAKGYSTKIHEEHGKLSLKTKTRAFSFGIGKWDIPETKIYLPKDIVFDVDLELGAGTANVEGSKYGNVKIDVGAGTFEIGDTVCKDFNADISAGKLTINSLTCTNFDTDVSAGKFETGKLECQKTNIDVSAGKFSVSSLVCPEIKVDVSAGTAEICVTGVKAEYSIITSVSAGSCNLSPQTGTTDKKIDADVSAGTINITFTE